METMDQNTQDIIASQDLFAIIEDQIYIMADATGGNGYSVDQIDTNGTTNIGQFTSELELIEYLIDTFPGQNIDWHWLDLIIDSGNVDQIDPKIVELIG